MNMSIFSVLFSGFLFLAFHATGNQYDHQLLILHWYVLFCLQVPMSVGINLTIEYFRNELLRSRHSQRNFHAPEYIKL